MSLKRDTTEEYRLWQNIRKAPSIRKLTGLSHGPFGDGIAVSVLPDHFASRQDLQRSLRTYAKLYTNSHPGRPTLDSNGRLHDLVDQFLRNHRLDEGQIMALYCGLDYRLSLINAASTEYLDLLRIDFPVACHQWDEDEWFLEQTEIQRETGSKIFRMLDGVLPQPSCHQGRQYKKPEWYLAAALAASCLGEGEIRRRIKLLGVHLSESQS
ncbi:hypothetical protein FQN54_000709 [Arachnomyces sp. PD_36]|nr:hypothetical protein FQN54_000709 [Arachnomyces sp. PD_36]